MGLLTESDLEKAEVLKHFFHSVFTDDKDDTLPDFSTRTTEILSHLEVTEDQMVKALRL